MFILFKIVCTMLIIVILLRKRVSIGNAMSAGGLLLWVMTTPEISVLITALTNTAKNPITWEIVLALYFVMCLEYQLRTSGTLANFMIAIQQLVTNERLTIAIMPAVLGFLPSLGGALFSCPMVETSSKRFSLTADKKSVINYWFRHIFEYTNPINPGILLASGIAMIPLGTLVWNMAWFTILMFFIGWVVLLRNLKPTLEPIPEPIKMTSSKRIGHISLALGPIFANFVFIVFFHLDAAISMALVTASMSFILRQKPNDIKKMLIHSLDKNLLWGIIGILIFQQILLSTGTITTIVIFFQQSTLPLAWTIGIISFVIGILTGTSQGYVAITFPIVAALAPGDLTIAITAFLLGFAGQMITPTHLCILVTIDYFNAEFIKTIKPVIFMETLMLLAVFIITHLTFVLGLLR